MAVQIGAQAHNFSDPTGLLSDCHRRIEMFLRVLEGVASVVDRPLTEETRAASLGRISPRSSERVRTTVPRNEKPGTHAITHSSEGACFSIDGFDRRNSGYFGDCYALE